MSAGTSRWTRCGATCAMLSCSRIMRARDYCDRWCYALAMGRMVALALAGMLCGCASNPSGSNWAAADLNKYGQNYAPFPTERLRIGMSVKELVPIFASGMVRVAAAPDGEVFKVDKWVSVAGPDYVDE